MKWHMLLLLHDLVVHVVSLSQQVFTFVLYFTTVYSLYLFVQQNHQHVAILL
jgi:hypothetical protein